MTVYERLQNNIKSLRLAREQNTFLEIEKNLNYNLIIPVHSLSYNLDYVRSIIRNEFNLKTKIIEDNYGEKYIIGF